MIPEFNEYDRLDRGYLELEFEEPVNQDNSEVDVVNAELAKIYGTWAELDWRDSYTCWVWPGRNKD